MTEGDNGTVIKLDGLDADRRYSLREISLPDGVSPRFQEVTLTGRELMDNGVKNPLTTQYDSAVLQLKAI